MGLAARPGVVVLHPASPRAPPAEATQLTILAATALARAIREYTGLAPDVKWPNDLLLRGRKVAGILTELTAETDRIRHVVLGIGLDVNQAAGDFPTELRRTATSLRLEAGRPFNRAELAVAILRALDQDYTRLKNGQFESIAGEWERLCTTLGRKWRCHRLPPRPRAGRIPRCRRRAAGPDRTRPPRTNHRRRRDAGQMILLLDIGNTHTHLGLAQGRRLLRSLDVPTAAWFDGAAARVTARFVAGPPLEGAAFCSVVPRATPRVRRALLAAWRLDPLELTHRTVRGVGIDYPRPASIGPDRLANAVAARHRFGTPVIVLDFGTAVTFDVVNAAGDYVGGIIAPGLAALTDYLHEKTALLPRIRIREVRRAIGRSTAEAMRIGAVRGYRGLIRELLAAVRRELGCRRLPVVATGGYARLMARGLPEITAVAPALTLEGVLEVWRAHRADKAETPRPRSLPRR